MAKTEKVSQPVEISGAREALAKLRGLPKEAQAAMRVAARAIVDEETPRIKAAGRRTDRQSALVAGVIRTKSDRYPTIVAGGKKKVKPSRRISRSTTEFTKSGKGKLVKPSAGDIFFGAEFGGRRRKTTMQFQRHTGRKGRWFWPTIRKDEKRIGEQWLEAVDQVADDWSDR